MDEYLTIPDTLACFGNTIMLYDIACNGLLCCMPRRLYAMPRCATANLQTCHIAHMCLVLGPNTMRCLSHCCRSRCSMILDWFAVSPSIPLSRRCLSRLNSSQCINRAGVIRAGAQTGRIFQIHAGRRCFCFCNFNLQRNSSNPRMARPTGLGYAETCNEAGGRSHLLSGALPTKLRHTHVCQALGDWSHVRGFVCSHQPLGVSNLASARALAVRFLPHTLALRLLARAFAVWLLARALAVRASGSRLSCSGFWLTP